MTGRFSNINPEQCAHYALFLKNLTLPQANGLFWSMFFLVLVFMVISSLQHQKYVPHLVLGSHFWAM